VQSGPLILNGVGVLVERSMLWRARGGGLYMRLVLNRRAGRLLRRLPRYTIYSAAELALLALLGMQCARLVYAIATPVGPLGQWRSAAVGGVSPAILGGFDPFFRLSSAGGPVVVTTLDLKLFGTRADQATGRGSAIIGLPDGRQASYAVGEEIVPGVTLKAVSFDGVTISRGGHDEQLFLDQSQPATRIAPVQVAQ
jgi:general secretion pathway protein C